MNKNTDYPKSTPTVKIIAITGCDGAGKSTLAIQLTHHFSLKRMTTLVYLGQSSGYIGQWLSHLPLIGKYIGRYVTSKADNIHQRSATPPDNVSALVIYLLSCWRAYKFRRMLLMCQKGYLLITDRYPQVEMPGFRVDGPQLAKVSGGNYWIRTLQRYEHKLYQWMASHPPTLLIRLNIDEKTAQCRKPDHPVSALREKLAVIPHLAFNGAQILDLDAREPQHEVLDRALNAVNNALTQKQQ